MILKLFVCSRLEQKYMECNVSQVFVFFFFLLWARRVINVRRRRAEMYSVLLD